MKTTHRVSLGLAAAALLATSSARADVIFSRLQNIGIPTDFNGVYLNLDTGVVAFPTFGSAPNWDINPFFGGAGLANSPRFQPVRTGTGNEDPIVRFNMGDTISGSLPYSTGYGGSQNSHLGSGTNQFQPGQQGYLGYQYSPSGTAYSGWMRVIFTANQPGGTLLDWAYDNTPGNTIAAGNIQEEQISGGSVVTLTAATGESPVLGTNLGDVAGGQTSLQKNGVGTWTLGAQSYTGTTTINAGTLAVGANGGKLTGTIGIVVNNGGTLLLTNNTTNDRINDGAFVTMAAGSTFNTGGLSEGSAAAPTAGNLAVAARSAASKQSGNRMDRPSWRSGASRWASQPVWDMHEGGVSDSEVAVSWEVGGGPRRYSPAGAPASGLGALTLQGTQMAPVIFDFGTLGGSTLIFSSLNALSAGTYVNILNWSGMAGMDNGAASNDRFLFASNTGFSQSDLANFHFIGYSPGATQIFYNGYFELVPVPEPSTWIAGILTVAAVAYSQRSRFVRKKSQDGNAAHS